jgi:FKBP-type peptidyl-prolyl cis-trans isomerase (trigger factor)
MPKNQRAYRPMSQRAPARLGVELSAKTNTTIYDYHELLSNRIADDTNAYLVLSEILEERESWLTDQQVQELLKSISRLALPSKSH